MKYTTYHPASQRVATYEDGISAELDLEVVAQLVAYYFRYHIQSGLESPEFGDGAVKFGKRIRILARHRNASHQRLFDVCVDGRVIDSLRVEVDPKTGLPKGEEETVG